MNLRLAGEPAASNPVEAEPRVRIGLLGPLRVSVEGEPVAVGRPQARLLLARLALSAGTQVTFDELTDALWPGEPPATARKSLQKYVSELRKLLGADSVTTEADGYSLTIDHDSLDIVRFERSLDQARAACGRGQVEEGLRLYDGAEALWRGTPMSEFADIAAIADEVRRLEELHLTAFEERMEAALAVGEDHELVSVLEDFVRKHPLRERSWGALMTALYRAGRQSDALAAYRVLRQILRDELGIEPAPEIGKLEERILIHDPSLAPTHQRLIGNLPAGYTSFVGRGKAIADLTRILGDARLATLVGPGGSGKTRLATELGRGVGVRYPDGVWFVDLAAAGDASQVLSAVSAALRVSAESGSSSEETLRSYLSTKRLLLILDNCEHVVLAVAALSNMVLNATRSVCILATSRESLGLTGEVVYRVDPLEVPHETTRDPDELSRVDSIRLFIERAAAADPDFRFSAEAAPVVAEICRRLEGLPLAVELAARQLHVIGLAELTRGLLDCLDLLAAPGAPVARHRTMQAAIEWSYLLLDEDQRRVFEVASVFPGTFTAEAVAHVSEIVHAEPVSAVPILTSLVSRSMVVREVHDDETRYRLLEPNRAYAAERIAAAGSQDALHRAHALWVLDLLLEHPQILGPDERQTLRRLTAERHHLPLAFDWAIEHEPELALQMLVAAREFIGIEEFRVVWGDHLIRAVEAGRDAPRELLAAALANGAHALSDSFADFATARNWAQEALTLATEVGDRRLAAIAEAALSIALRSMGALDEARTRSERARDIFDAEGDAVWSARCRNWVSQIALATGDHETAVAELRTAIDRWADVGSDWGSAKAWWILAATLASKGDYAGAEAAAATSVKHLEGFDEQSVAVHVRAVRADAARLTGKYEEARSMYIDCLRVFEEIGDRRCVASSLKNLGLVAWHLGRYEDAAGSLIAAFERRRALRDDAGIPETLEGLAFVAEHAADHDLAVALLGVVSRLRAITGAMQPEPERLEIEALIARLKTAMSETDFEGAWSRAENEPEDLIAQARRLAAPASTATPPS